MPQPKAHKYKRAKRLSCARTWIETYKGKTLYHGYAKHFGVSKLCAILKLEMLGYVFSDELKESIKRSEIDKQVQREKRKAKKEAEHDLVESDEYFAYIAGYTSGGQLMELPGKKLKKWRTTIFKLIWTIFQMICHFIITD
jgi:hypothetical protein